MGPVVPYGSVPVAVDTESWLELVLTSTQFFRGAWVSAAERAEDVIHRLTWAMPASVHFLLTQFSRLHARLQVKVQLHNFIIARWQQKSYAHQGVLTLSANAWILHQITCIPMCIPWLLIGGSSQHIVSSSDMPTKPPPRSRVHRDAQHLLWRGEMRGRWWSGGSGPQGLRCVECAGSEDEVAAVKDNSRLFKELSDDGRWCLQL